MRYMTFIIHSEDYRQEDVPKSLFEAMGKFVEESQKSGVFVDGAGLQPTKAGFRVRLSKGKLKLSDGPFTETKEVVGGYALIEAKSTQEATDIAMKFMEIHRVHWPEFEGVCEVRPLEAEAQPQG
ncbi:MAG: hypothetical protein HYY49_05380 [Ignavibacteriales bacterium]|nr:hypothetical protein [Ignavibacteriales bacterium]